jgi:hypothetical protein
MLEWWGQTVLRPSLETVTNTECLPVEALLRMDKHYATSRYLKRH